MKRLVKETLFGDERDKGRHYTTDTTSTTTFGSTPSFYEQKEFVETTTVPGLATAATNVMTSPVIVEKLEKPTVVQEVIKPGTREEIQPIVHREREQTEIRKLIQPVYEKDIRATMVEERELAAEYKPEVRIGTMPLVAEGPRSSSITETMKVETIVKAPIVRETVRRKIIEEIQPVIYREVVAPRLIRETKPIYEKVVEAPVVSYATLPPRYTTDVGRSGFAQTQWTQPAQTWTPVETVTTTTSTTEILPANTAIPMANTTGSPFFGEQQLSDNFNRTTIQEREFSERVPTTNAGSFTSEQSILNAPTQLTETTTTTTETISS